VTGYVVESKSSSYYAWTSCSVGVRVSEPHFVVPNLVDGTSYEFRVVAENRSGRSEPSAPSTPVVVRDIAGRLRGTVVERRNLTGELSLSCTRPAADG